MHYEGNIIRPPSEANSILLQVTVGCSHNQCTFCGAYSEKRFKIKSDQIILDDIVYAARHFSQHTRLFLCDGDALIIKQDKLLWILTSIRKHLPNINRVGIYANAKSLQRKSREELVALRELGLGIVYMGLESGDAETLKQVHKKSTPDEQIIAGKKVRAAGLKLSITVILGLASRERSQIHAKATGNALTQIDPNYVGALSLMLVPGTVMHQAWESKAFYLLNAMEMLQELKTMIAYTELSRGLFFANHASNYLPIKARLPKDKKMTLELIEHAIKGNIMLKPEFLRGL